MAPPPPARKFGAPLFFCTFTDSSDGTEVVLGGGGGASSTGVANRLLLVPVEENETSKGAASGPHKYQLECDPSSELHTGSLTVVSGTWVEKKPYFLSVLSGGEGLVKYKLDRGKDGKKEFAQLKYDKAKLASLKQAEIKTVVSNNAGTQVAVGFDTGKIVVYDVEGLESLRTFDPEKHEKVLPSKGGIMSLCFTPCDSKLIAVKDNGTAFIWDQAPKETKKKAKKKGSSVVTKFPTDAGLFRGCHAWEASNAKTYFSLGVNGKNRRSNVSTWVLTGKDAKIAAMQTSRPAHNAAITALAGSRTNKLVATASSEGEICVYSLEHKLALLQRVPNAHMIFVTNLGFSVDGKRLVSCSADAGARILTITKTGDQIAMERNLLIALLFLVIALLLAMLGQR